MKKTNIFIGTFYAAIFGAPLLLVGCDALPNLWGSNNNQPYYSNSKKPYNNPNYNKRTSKAEVNSSKAKASNTTATRATYAADNASNSSSSSSSSNSSSASSSVAPKASSAASNAIDSPIVPTTTPAVE
ncbi:Uncharacterised protein [Legionella beliardensis]|uniref:Lipoprotein n=1 Tax=Legionella beliardensis TaxID=91822 RepID=A0A378HXH2_9GAMM|nr:hypothetical protein [Legionella beliardensis]STX27628.1 Uncharacterised protein [Legionella beliardensis]